jgi:hypothetical protein
MSDLGTEESFQFRSLDGERLTATLSLPKGSSKGYAILVHGITSERNEAGFYTEMAKQLRERGIASIRADWRCHGDNKLPSSELSLSGIINDINAASREAAHRLDPQGEHSISVVAASFGGGAAVLWASTHEERIKSLVLLAPVLDYSADLFRHAQIDENWYLSETSVEQLATEGQVPTSSLPIGRAMINELPFSDVPKAIRETTIPITVFHGEADSDVFIDYSRRYCKEEFGCHLIPVPGVDHGFIKPGTDFYHPESQENHRQIIPRIVEVVASSLARIE